MRKKYVKPELINIITVEAGKPVNGTKERMGTKAKVTGAMNHLATTIRITNHWHHLGTTKGHISAVFNKASSNGFIPNYFTLTNTQSASDVGPS